MRYLTVARTFGILLLATGLAGCAGIEKKKDDLKAKGIEFEGAKAMKVYRF